MAGHAVTIQLRDYQTDLKSSIYDAWRGGVRNVMAVLPCGGGKTAIFSNIIAEMGVPSAAIAHRTELVSQMSLALARNEVRHRIIGQNEAIRSIVHLHMITVGKSYYDATARCAVASVNTLVNKKDIAAWAHTVRLWITDECQHLLSDNIWGRAVDLFPNAIGLGVTATPVRADGKGLGRHHDGVIDAMVVGSSMRDLISRGYLSEYRIFAPPSDLNLSDVNVTAGGDYSPEPLRRAVHRSHIHGDVVSHYMRLTPGKLGVTFAVDVESAVELAAAFRQQGVPAEMLSGTTPANNRYKILAKFAAGEIKQLCTCDIISEGFDLPAVEVCSMARPTQSYGLYIQQFGRALRIFPGKSTATLLDHVGNVLLHGLPDAARGWSLDRRDRRSRRNEGDAPIPLRSCLGCAGVYERTRVVCPYCGYKVEPAGRGSPEMVDGSLIELDPDVLARMRGEIAAAEQLRIPYGAAPEVVGALRRNHRERMEAQTALRAAMAQWGGNRTAVGVSIAEAQRTFFFKFGIDVGTAQTLNAREAAALAERVNRG